MSNLWTATQVGNGPDVVLLHGWGMSGAVFTPLVEALSQDFRISTLDLPGHGQTPLMAFDLDSAVAALAATLIHLDLQQPHLLGWSLGGQIALAFAATYPEAFGRLILVSSTPRFVAAPDWPHGMSSEHFASFGDSVAHDSAATLQRFFALQTLGDPQARKAMQAVQQAVLTQMPTQEGLTQGLAILARTDLRHIALEQPTLLLQGGYDRIVPPAAALYWAGRWPQAQVHMLPKAGHAPFLSEPALCAKRIRDFLHVLELPFRHHE